MSGSRVVAVEAVGPYTLLRLERGALDPGTPGQFFMLEAPGLPAAAARSRSATRPAASSAS